MEVNKKFKAFLENQQAYLFYQASLMDIDLVGFIKTYMKSDIAKAIDSEYSSLQTTSVYALLNMVLLLNPKLKGTGFKKYNPAAAMWLGYLYRKWCFLTGESSKHIVNILPPLDGLKSYFNLHQMDEETAIMICKRNYNIKRNAHRYFEYKKDPSLKVEQGISNDDKESFAKTILEKLDKSNVYKKLKINYSKDSEYNLLSPDYEVGVSVKTIDDSDNDSLLTLFDKENDRMMYSNRVARNSLLFIINNGHSNLSFDTLKEHFLERTSKYNSLYIYSDGVLYTIDKVFGITSYNLSTSLSKIHKTKSEL